MSIASIINTANSGLSVAQARIALASTNIANAETAGYTKKTADVTASTVGGQATGVTIIGTGSDVDEKLHQDVVEAISQSSYDSVLSSYYETVVTALGTTSDGSELSDTLTALQTALSDAIDDPSTTTLTAVEEAVDDWNAAIADASDAVQSARTSADQGIAEAVESVNDLLHQIDDLNDQITKAKANGESTSDLEDQRRAALEDLGQYMEVTTFTTTAGATQIYTTSGQALLTSTVHQLSYTATGTLTSSATYESDGSGTISGIMVDGKDVTNAISGGTIAALVELRDEVLPAVQEELDALSGAVSSAISGIDAALTSAESGDTSALQTIWSALSDTTSFADAGNLSATSASISSYLSSLIDDLADRASAASSAATKSAATAESLSTSFSNSYGINVNEETALLTTYQQDYDAAAQILSAAQEMWDSLISMMN